MSNTIRKALTQILRDMRASGSWDAPTMNRVIENVEQVFRSPPLGVWFGSTQWHPEPQWFLKARDTEKDAERDFALNAFGTTGERGSIVAWLRKKAERHSEMATAMRDSDIDLAKTHKSIAHTSLEAADAIESGDHLLPGAGR